MKTRILAAVLAVFLAVGFGADRAGANDGHNYVYSTTSACASAKISHAQATCLKAWWGKPSNIRKRSYRDYFATNLCTEYGTVTVQFDGAVRL